MSMWRRLSDLWRKHGKGARLLAARPWEAHELGSFRTPPTMLSKEEIRVLHWLGRDYFRGRGEIVDAGCFLGGSTAALADGVAKNLAVGGTRRRIHSYDTFAMDWYAKETFFADSPLQIGDSFVAEWRQSVRGFEDLIVLHRGDVCTQRWAGQPIEILFLDLMKTVEIQTAVTERWLPCLLAGRSVVVQQDYVHEWQPWIIVSMELLRDYFVPFAYYEYGSAVYLCVRVPTREAVMAADVSALPLEAQMDAADRASTRVPERYLPVFRLAGAKLLLDAGRHAEARQRVTGTLERWPADPRAARVGQVMLGACRE